EPREHRGALVSLVGWHALDVISSASLNSSTRPVVNLVIPCVWPFWAKAKHCPETRRGCLHHEKSVSENGIVNSWPIAKALRLCWLCGVAKFHLHYSLGERLWG